MAESFQSRWGQVETYAAKLIDALDGLDDAGGLRRASADWKPAIRDKARARLKEARLAIMAAEEQLKAKSSPKPPQPEFRSEV